MRYYKHLYLTEGLEKKKEKIIRKLESGKLQLSVYEQTGGCDIRSYILEKEQGR